MSDSLQLKAVPEGTLVPVRVSPRASKTGADGVRNGELRVRLHAPPVDGAANQALRDYLASTLRCPKRSVEIVRGERSRSKLILVRDHSPAEISAAFLAQ